MIFWRSSTFLRDVAHGVGVPLARLPSRARRVAPVDRVLDARTLQPSVDRDRARAQREELARQAQRLPHRGGGIERPIVRGAVVLHPARHQQPREVLVGRELEERVVLVVAQDDVVARTMLAHEVGLEHERLELVVGDDELEIGDVPDEGVGLGIGGPRDLEVRPHAPPQRRRLADIDHLRLGVLVQVHARPLRQAGQLLVESHPRPL
jgi:hypothetical protein